MEILATSPSEPTFGDFIELPWRIYPGQVKWVPPLRAQLAAELAPAHNPFFGHGEAQAFVAMRGGEVQGRVVAAIDYDQADADVGMFGYFECIDDPDVAHGLLTAAEGWLRARGKSRAVGPIDLTIHRRYRLMTAGFDREPFLAEPRNPEYYLRLVTAAGYQPHRRWHSWDLTRDELAQIIAGLKQGLDRRVAEGREDGCTIEPFDPGEVERDLRRLHTLFNLGFASNFAATQLSVSEFLSIYGGLVPLLGDHLCLPFATKGGRDVGFAYVYGDLAPAFLKIDGDAQKLALAAEMPPHAAVLHTFTVVPEVRESGAAQRLAVAALSQTLDRGYSRFIGALATEGRTIYDRVHPPTRSYAVYDKPL